MTDTTPEQILSRTQVPAANGRPIRKDEIELHDRGVYVESWLPERRSRRKPLLFVHGELAGSWLWERYLGFFASRGWEGHALNLQNHYWSRTADPTELTFETYVGDVVAVLGRLGPTTVLIGHGMGGLLALKAAEQAPIGGIVLLSPEPPAAVREPAQTHELRDVPDVYGRARLGWSTLPEKLQRDHRDLTIADVLRIQHMLGQKPHESGRARRAVLGGVPVDARIYGEIPRLVIGAGLDQYVSEPTSEAVAQWLDAQYEPFGAHSHFGLVLGERSHQQVADAIRGFLEVHRL
ncbi:MAG TPA: alpha/beta fold hydrolase [Candidatus Limnocylindrales bacterium]|jgi:pimeloyl-ACP methyl ester carboxylesterase